MTENIAHGSGGAVSAFNSRTHLSEVTFQGNEVRNYHYTNPARDGATGQSFLLPRPWGRPHFRQGVGATPLSMKWRTGLIVDR